MNKKQRLSDLLSYNFDKTVEAFKKKYGESSKEEEIMISEKEHLYIPSKEIKMPEIMIKYKEGKNNKETFMISFSNASTDNYVQASLDIKTLFISYNNKKLRIKDENHDFEIELNSEDRELSESFAMLITSFITSITF